MYNFTWTMLLKLFDNNYSAVVFPVNPAVLVIQKANYNINTFTCYFY